MYRVENWFQWILDAHKDGYSDADIRFVLDVSGVRDGLRRALEADAKKRSEGT
jgi:hypothetical protein